MTLWVWQQTYNQQCRNTGAAAATCAAAADDDDDDGICNGAISNGGGAACCCAWYTLWFRVCTAPAAKKLSTCIWKSSAGLLQKRNAN